MKYIKFPIFLAMLFNCNILSAQESTIQKEQAEFMQSRTDSVAVGKAIPDFTMVNERLEEVQFSSLLGKTVVIDIWATWCKPCIALSPAFEKVKEELQNEAIVFLSISVDQDEDKWINYTEEHQVNYDRYWVGKEAENPIVWFTFGEFEHEEQKVWAESIPRFIVVNKSGKVELLNFGQPGMPSFKKAIKKALKN